MSDRKAFEAWWGTLVGKPAEPYSTTVAAWQAWQAALAHARQQGEPVTYGVAAANGAIVFSGTRDACVGYIAGDDEEFTVVPLYAAPITKSQQE